MDPLSAIASVAGIASAAGEIVKILGPYITAAKDAPKIAAQLSSEALATQTILSALERLAGNFSNSNVQYASLIRVDQLVAVLTDGVLIFSELEELLQTLPPPEPTSPGSRLWSPMQWVRKKGTLTALFTRLQAFKLSISCILSILQSDSQVRAEDHQQQLISTVGAILESNHDLSQKIMGIESAFDTISQCRVTTQSTADIDNQTGGPHTTLPKRFSLFEFERDLNASRVYRRAKRDTMDFSIRSSVARTNAWSIFSGISLSNISEMSVLALPLYAEDIANPQHYNFGRETLQPEMLLSASFYTRSIYHECVEVQLQLSQLAWFAEFHRQETQRGHADANPLSILVAVFRHGTPLLMLLNQLDNSHNERWNRLIASKFSPDTTAKLAVSEFIQACANTLNLPLADCFTIADLMSDDTTKHVKVIRLVRIIQARLIEAGLIKATPFESTLQISPQGLAMNEFLRDERFYLTRLESLLETTEHIVSSSTSPFDTFQQMSVPLRLLVHVQRQFLIKAEMLVENPYLNQTWQSVFQEWSIESTGSYAVLIATEVESKSKIRTALSSVDNHNDERWTRLGDALAVLGLPAQRLEKYQAFLQEISQHRFDESNEIKSAKESLQSVKEAVCAAVNTKELDNANAALLKGLDDESRVSVLRLGKLLMFDNVRITEFKGGPVTYIPYYSSRQANQTHQNRLYLFDRGILQAMEGPKSLRRGLLGYRKLLPEDLTPQLYVVRIIHGREVHEVFRALENSTICTIEYSLGGGFGRLSFSVSSEARMSEWIMQLKTLHDRPVLTKHIRKPRTEYKLVVVGGSGSGTSSLTFQFIDSAVLDRYDRTREDSYRKECTVDGKSAILNVVDTTGQHDYPAMRQLYMSTGEGFLLLYSVTSRQSFNEVKAFRQEILEFKDTHYRPMVLVGNNCFQTSRREVTKREGESLAMEFGCPFFEADAESRMNVDEAFFDLVREIRQYDQERASDEY